MTQQADIMDDTFDRLVRLALTAIEITDRVAPYSDTHRARWAAMMADPHYVPVLSGMFRLIVDEIEVPSWRDAAILFGSHTFFGCEISNAQSLRDAPPGVPAIFVVREVVWRRKLPFRFADIPYFEAFVRKFACAIFPGKPHWAEGGRLADFGVRYEKSSAAARDAMHASYSRYRETLNIELLN